MNDETFAEISRQDTESAAQIALRKFLQRGQVAAILTINSPEHRRASVAGLEFTPEEMARLVARQDGLVRGRWPVYTMSVKCQQAPYRAILILEEVV